MKPQSVDTNEPPKTSLEKIREKRAAIKAKKEERRLKLAHDRYQKRIQESNSLEVENLFTIKKNILYTIIHTHFIRLQKNN